MSVDGRDVFVASAWHEDTLHHVVAAVVDRAAATFTPVRWQQLTTGAGYYAPTGFRDAEGRPCLVFWIRGLHDRHAGRAGALSVPHLLSLAEDGSLVLRLHPAVTSRAREHRDGSNAALVEPEDLTSGPVSLCSDGDVVVRLAYDDGLVIADVTGEVARLPVSPRGVQVVVDGPCVEVLTSGSAFAHVVPRPVQWDDEVCGALARWLE